MEIRAFASTDRPALLELVTSALEVHGFGAFVGGALADLAALEDRYAGPRAGFWVAVDGDTLLGSIAIRPKGLDEPEVAELKRLYVDARARGRGVGQDLYLHAESFASRVGYERLWLDSSRRFAAARRLYERNGFVLVASLDNDWEDNVYEKRLI